MSSWKLKALVQGGMSLLPKSQAWNHLVQKYITQSLELPSQIFEDKLRECNEHLKNYHAFAQTPETSFNAFEIGTGWHPILPVYMYLCGASRVWTMDKTLLTSPTRIENVLRLFVEYAQDGRLANMIPWIHNDRLQTLRDVLQIRASMTPFQMLEKINIRHIIGDARLTGLEASSVDFLVSSSTLEYIPEQVLQAIFFEFRRIASPGAVMSHFIICGDHYADYDSSITHFNFLKYSERFWRLCNNSIHFQNRLRRSDYRKIHQEAGFHIIKENNLKGSVEDLDSINVAKKFRKYDKDDLLTQQTWIVSTRNEKGNAG